jgi:hypothetical protein
LALDHVIHPSADEDRAVFLVLGAFAHALVIKRLAHIYSPTSAKKQRPEND